MHRSPACHLYGVQIAFRDYKAALGITEVSDASAIVVSEETGEISFAEAGKMRTMGSITELRLAIENSFKQ